MSRRLGSADVFNLVWVKRLLLDKKKYLLNFLKEK